MENSIIQELNAEADRTMPILIFKNPKLKIKNPKLNGNPKNIIISITALSTLKNQSHGQPITRMILSESRVISNAVGARFSTRATEFRMYVQDSPTCACFFFKFRYS